MPTTKKSAPKSTDQQILAELREFVEQVYIKFDQNCIPKLDKVDVIIAQNAKLLTYAKSTLLKVDQIQKEQLEQREILDELLLRTPPQVARVVMEFDLEGQITEGEVTMLNTQFVTATIALKGAGGKPAKVDGALAWAASDDTKVTITPDATTGLTARIDAVGPDGTVDITATGDADLGAGVQTIFAKGTLTIDLGGAIGMEMTFSDPVDQ